MNKKIFQIAGLENHVKSTDMANMFTVNYDEQGLPDPLFLSYNINKTILFTNLAKAPTSYFKTYTPREYDAWTTISFNEYGTVNLWWLLCKVNDIIDPTIEPFEFGEMRILKNEHVNTILNKLRTE